MCILSLVNGTPAFNISYEVKGRECYKYLGLAAYSVDFNESKDNAATKFNAFVNDYKNIQASLPQTLAPVHEECRSSLDNFLAELNIR
jgi:polysaccharide pyruvyl transferase WcaK-like protein